MKAVCKNIIRPIVCNDLVVGFFDFLNKGKLRVLYYHQLTLKKNQDELYDPWMFVEKDVFDSQMSFLKKHYCPVSEEDVIAALEGRIKLPPNAVWVTFDDGYKDNFTIAYPILKKQGVPATFFITTGYIDQSVVPAIGCVLEAFRLTDLRSIDIETEGRVRSFDLGLWPQRKLVAARVMEFLGNGRPITSLQALGLAEQLKVSRERMDLDFMGWDEIREMGRSGAFIGAHTVTHPVLSALNKDELEWEVIESKRRIEQKAGVMVRSFAYPYGGDSHYDLKTISPALARSEIKIAVTTARGLNDLHAADRFRMRRMDIGLRIDENILRFDLAVGLRDT